MFSNDKTKLEKSVENLYDVYFIELLLVCLRCDHFRIIHIAFNSLVVDLNYVQMQYNDCESFCDKFHLWPLLRAGRSLIKLL